MVLIYRSSYGSSSWFQFLYFFFNLTFSLTILDGIRLSSWVSKQKISCDFFWYGGTLIRKMFNNFCTIRMLKNGLSLLQCIRKEIF